MVEEIESLVGLTILEAQARDDSGNKAVRIKVSDGRTLHIHFNSGEGFAFIEE